ncbi:MAG: PTS fructose transporter subunit IIA [Acidobacteriota bacterium]
MIGTLILTHGGLADEFLASAQKINGPVAQFDAISLKWSSSPDAARDRVRKAIHDLDCGSGVLILTDAFGTTPCNVAMGFYDPGRVEVVSGVNLPMVMRLACLGNLRTDNLADAAHWLAEKGKQSICVAGDRLTKANGESPPADEPCGD